MTENRWTIVLDRDDYVSLSTSQIAAVLNVREAAILLSIMPIILTRSSWLEMTDNQWNVLEGILASLQEKLLS